MKNFALDRLIADGALFAVNHSGGKDSQAMMIELMKLIPRRQMIVVHATLGEIEWDGALELAEENARDAGVPFIVARAVDKAGNPKTFFDMVEHNFARRPDAPCWPSPKYRQCTSDLKRGPINREIRRFAKAHGFTTIVNCEGVRAAESATRAKRNPFELNKRESKAGRTWFEWLPIFELSTEEVFAIIRAAGQTPHPAYAAGNERLSCTFCIMGSRNDLRHGAIARPELFRRYCELEEKTGYTMHASMKPLRDLVGPLPGA